MTTFDIKDNSYQAMDSSINEQYFDDFSSAFSVSEGKGSLTTSGAVFAIISTVVGAGMVAVPFAFYQIGLYAGIGISIAQSI